VDRTWNSKIHVICIESSEEWIDIKKDRNEYGPFLFVTEKLDVYYRARELSGALARVLRVKVPLTFVP